MEEWLLARGYSKIVVNNQIDKVVCGRDQSVKRNLESGIPFITTCHPKVKELGKLIRDVLPFLYSDREVQKVFSPPPIVCYRSARKIKDCIVRSKLYLVEKNVGCQRCGSSTCEVCKNINVTDEFTSFTTKKSYKINHSFDSNEKCLIYRLSCKSCGKQDVGNTTDHFRSRWNNYNSDVRKAESGNLEDVKQKFLQSRFLQLDQQGFLKDVEIRLIHKTQASDPTKKEFYWMRTLKTLYPDGLNIESDY